MTKQKTSAPKPIQIPLDCTLCKKGIKSEDCKTCPLKYPKNKPETKRKEEKPNEKPICKTCEKTCKDGTHAEFPDSCTQHKKVDKKTQHQLEHDDGIHHPFWTGD